MTDTKINTFDFSKEMKKVLIKSYSSDKQEINQVNLIASLIKRQIETSEEITIVNYEWLLEYAWTSAGYDSTHVYVAAFGELENE